MKKIVISIVGSILISLCAVQAQEQKQDTTGMASKSRNKQQYDQSQQKRDQQQQEKDQAWQQQSDRSENAYANEGMVIIEKDEIPSSLKQTLQREKKYAGWENATIYRNTNTGEYVIAPRAYRFDEQGKEIEMGDAAYGSRDGRQSRYSQDQSTGRNTQQPPERTSQSQQGQDQRDETSTYSSERQSDDSRQYQDNQASQTKRNQTQRTQPQSYDQAAGNQQQPDDQSTRDQQETADQPSQSQEQSSAYRRQDQSQQSQRDGQQQPSTGYRSGQNDQSRTNDQNEREQPSQSQYRTEDMVEIQAEQVPASLRRTLSERQYSGWEENGKLYQDPSTNEYVLVMEKSSNASQPRTYRFDKNGQLKDDPSESGQRNQGQ